MNGWMNEGCSSFSLFLSLACLRGVRTSCTGHFWQHPAVSVWKVVGQHLSLNIIPIKFMAWTGWKVWCDRGTSRDLRMEAPRSIPFPFLSFLGFPFPFPTVDEIHYDWNKASYMSRLRATSSDTLSLLSPTLISSLPACSESSGLSHRFGEREREIEIFGHNRFTS